MFTGGKMKEKIWRYLLDAGLTEEGAAGLMGNLQAESGLRPDRVEILCLKKLAEHGKHYTDATYTALVDDGTITMESFLHPLPGCQYGYGLAQWTSPDRKAGLYTLAKSRGVSIGDLAMQLDWLITELKQGYVGVWKILTTTKEVLAASNAVLTRFEMPADTGTAVREMRFKNSLAIYESMKDTKVTGGTDMVHIISNCGHDENGGYVGGIAGDQTGTEWELCAWYSRPWNCVLRHPDAAVREKLAELAEKAAKNNRIGYDQYQRNTYWTYLQRAGYDPSKITNHCETDCSAGVIANTKAVGHLLGIDKLKALTSTYTGNMRSGFAAAGFQVLTDSKYLTSPDYLLPGDILLNDQHHTATNISKGSKADSTSTASDPSLIVGTCQVTLKEFLQGATDPQIKTIQRLLNARGYKGVNGQPLDIDGNIGPNTAYAIGKFQRDKGMKDINFGSVAGTTWRYLLEA